MAVDGLQAPGELALYAAAVVAAVLVMRQIVLRLLAWALGFKTGGGRRIGLIQPDGVPTAVSGGSRRAGSRQAVGPDTGHDRRLTREERRRLAQGQSIQLRAPRGLRGGALLLDDLDGMGADTAQPPKPDVVERLLGDLKRCASGRAVAALMEEPRYAQPFPAVVMKAILNRLFELRARSGETLAAVESCHFHAGLPVAVRRRFINLVCEEDEIAWQHTSQVCVACQPVDLNLRTDLVPRAWRVHRNALFVYFDADDRLVGWQVLGKVASLKKPT